ncbi:MAG: HK97 family phage prohead protease [Aestuariivirga sp.]|uniref:HK97 family phage prohead protease n=1 Tax=Aestuariivirga sp. TaxID=2650926 RepID=UPI0025C5F38C|nr:HK97 family phage prohead protease [Aestuariivirga sp.]MCA3562352.1 HK97 family phage prohead protease [Aestuariivirga sp.]
MRHLDEIDLDHGSPLELRFAGDTETGEISGYGSVFKSTDLHGDVVAPGAFGASMAKHRAARTMPLMLWAHDLAQPIGVWQDAREDDRGLAVKGKLNLDTQRGREAYSLLRQGALNGLSIGFRVPPSGAKSGLKGRRILTEIDLYEVSIVTFPSNTGARVTNVKSAGLQLRDRAHLEDLLREAGLSRGAARAVAAGGWPQLTKSAESDERAAQQLLRNLRTLNTHLRNS